MAATQLRTRTRQDTPLVRATAATTQAAQAARAATGWTIATARTFALSLTAAILIGAGLWHFYQWNTAGRILAPIIAGLLVLAYDAITATPDESP